METFLAAYGATVFWGVVLAVALIAEINTGDMVAIWFMPGAFAAFILSLFSDRLWIQAVLFVGLSFIALLLTKVVFRKLLPPKTVVSTNADALIGMQAVVEEPIDNIQGHGSVRVNGLVWTARSGEDDKSIPAGSIVTVCGISGVKLICKPEN